MRCSVALTVCLLLWTPPVFAQRSEPVKELAPRLVNLAKEEIALSAALKALQEQTGNVVHDRRTNASEVRLRLELKNATFWQALDDMVRQAGCGYSLYQQDGELALVDTPLRKMPVTYSGIFRVAAKRVAVVRDADSGSHACNVTLEVAWEPRFQPFLLDIGAMDATFAAAPGERPTKARAVGTGKVEVWGRGAVEVDVRLKAPPRASAAILELTGRFDFLGPTKMLTFDFSSIKPGETQTQTQDDIEAVMTPLPRQTKKWSYEVRFTKPEMPAGLDESFRQGIWLNNNRILLRNRERGKVETITPLPSEVDMLSGPRAAFRYDFTRDLPESPAGWTLQYRTPSRIVELPMTFSLGEIALP